jgi:DNA-binding transcriptional MerR regulator
MVEKKYFTINEVARALGVSKQTLVRYEKKDIFPRPKRNPLNKWREYTLKDITVLKNIMGRLE